MRVTGFAPRRFAAAALLSILGVFLVYVATQQPGGPAGGAPPAAPLVSGPPPPLLLTRSSDCATCHPEFYAEWRQDQHATSWAEEEFRIFTSDYQRVECLSCHAPRPMFDVGLRAEPQLRAEQREDGVGCLACHAQAGRMCGTRGGAAPCGGIRQEALRTAEACFHCHSAHNLFNEYAASEYARRGQTCQDCHMQAVARPLVPGGPVRATRRHVFHSGGHDAAALKTVLDLRLSVAAGELVVTVTNQGAAHGVPGEINNRVIQMNVFLLVPDPQSRREMELGAYREHFRAPRRFARGKVPTTQVLPGEPRVFRYPLPAAHGKAQAFLIYRLEAVPSNDEAVPMASREMEF